ncbi:hypothetical protein PanWU01x14_241600, partial [Parasponia andersonii]
MAKKPQTLTEDCLLEIVAETRRVRLKGARAHYSRWWVAANCGGMTNFGCEMLQLRG